MERLIHRRLDNHKLLQSDLREPAAIVGWLGAVQSQDFRGAMWALGQRASGLPAAAIVRAYDAGAILRTHVLRPTWHFVTPADIGWMLMLTAPRVQRFNAPYYRQFDLDPRTLSRTRSILARTLEGDVHLTRSELADALKRARIEAKGIRLALVTIDAELNQVICSGAMRGKQFTYARFDTRVPRSRTFTHDEALAELTRRYFASHGPATMRDFAWWSGLTMSDVKAGIALMKPEIAREVVGDLEYWTIPSDAPRRRRASSASLLPTYDEYLIAYKDRAMVVGASRPLFRERFAHHVVIDGMLAGSWKPMVTGTGVLIDVSYYDAPTAPQRRALERAAAMYGRFVGKSAVIR